MTEWQIFLLMVVIFAINNRFAVWNYKRMQKLKQEKFLRAVTVEYPNAKLAFIAIDTSDEAAMAKLEADIRENRYIVSD